jgi:hypothetical protein
MPHYKVELSEVLNDNPGMETGDFTGWSISEESPTDIDVTTTTVFTGDYSGKISGVDSRGNGARTNVFSVNNKYKHTVKFFVRIESNFTSNFFCRYREYANQSDNISSHFNNTVIYSDNALSDWNLQSFTLGASGDNVDFVITDSTNGLSIEMFYPDESSGNLAYFDNVTFMQLIYVTPEWNNAWSLSEIQLKNQNRAAAGALFIRKQGEYDKITIGQSNLSMEDSTVINSWYNKNKELVLEISSGDSVTSFTTQPYSVMIVNGDTPFQERVLPYDGEFQGIVELEGY